MEPLIPVSIREKPEQSAADVLLWSIHREERIKLELRLSLTLPSELVCIPTIHVVALTGFCPFHFPHLSLSIEWWNSSLPGEHCASHIHPALKM